MLGPGGGGSLTSAYYIGNPFTGCGDLPCAGKCYHGNYTSFCVGVNKDRDDSTTMLDDTARDLARIATSDYLSLITSEISGNPAAIAALLDVQGTVGFVIDDTGSMGEEIGGVQQIVTFIVEFLKNASVKNNWLLERFGDPDVGPPFVTEDAATLLSAVNALFASGGGDCPEFSQAALIEAIGASRNDSCLFFFSDADAKDSSKQNLVISGAQAKRIEITYVITNSCSFQPGSGFGVDPAYVRGANETGGQLFVIDQFEIGNLFELLEPLLEGDLQRILTLNGDAGGTPTEFAVPVDSTVTQLSVSVSKGPGVVAELRRPSGEPVMSSDPDVTIRELTGATFILVDDPQAGAWTAVLSGVGEFSLSVSGNSLLELASFEFVEPNADIHGGYFPIEGQPLVGNEAIGRATLFGDYGTASFALFDPSGTLVAPIELSQGFADAFEQFFMGSFVPPPSLFRVVVTGTDENGLSYRREFPPLFGAQTIGVSITGAELLDVVPGEIVTIEFTVTSVGGVAASFLMVAADSLGFPITVTPDLIGLEPGSEATVVVVVQVPEDADEGAVDVITLSATNTLDPTIFNSSSVTLLVGASAPLCPWDLDGDSSIGISDLLALLMSFGPCDGECPADFNEDGDVNVFDFLTLLFNFGPCPDGSCPWDVNGDGIVDHTDLFQVFGNFGPCDGCPEDVSGDGVVNGEDLIAVITHFGPCP